MAGVFYFSDPHFFHARLAELRGFGEDVDLHNEALVHNYHSLIKKKDDLVWILGDLTIGGTTVEGKALDLLKKLPGRKRLILGNHDSVSSTNRNPEKNYSKYNEVFEYVGMYVRKRIAGFEVEFSHYPFTRDHKPEPRLMEHRRPNYGQWLFHGHCHDRIIKEDQQIHVGLDAHQLTPVPHEQMIAWMQDTRTLITTEDHYG